MQRWCPACEKAPSCEVPGSHERCEFCAGPLEHVASADLSRVAALRERVLLSCHRCGRAFEAERGSRPFCSACELGFSDESARAPSEPAEAPSAENDAADTGPLLWAAAWGAALPVTVRLCWLGFIGDQPSSPLVGLLSGIGSFAVALGLLSLVARMRGEAGRVGTPAEQGAALVAMLASIGLLTAMG